MRISITSLTFLTLGIFLLALLYLHTSLWFLWHASPSGNIKIALDRTHVSSPLIIELLSRSNLDQFLSSIEGSKRFVYVENKNSSSLIIAPSGLFSFRSRTSITANLNKQGWQARSLGLIIIAQKDKPPPSPQAISIIYRTLKSLLSPHLPFSPTLLASSTQKILPFIPDTTAAIAATDNRKGELTTTLSNDFGHLILDSSKILHPPQMNQLTLAIQSKYMNNNITNFLSSWNKKLQDSFSLTKSSPDFSTVFADADYLSIDITDNSAGLTLTGNADSLSQTLQSLLSAEDAFHRPATRAFRLPDSTYGREIISGEPRPVLTEIGDDGCQAPLYDTVPLWLCRNNNTVSLATTKETALQILSGIDHASWLLFIGESYLALPDNFNLKYLQIFNKNNVTTIKTAF